MYGISGLVRYKKNCTAYATSAKLSPNKNPLYRRKGDGRVYAASRRSQGRPRGKNASPGRRRDRRTASWPLSRRLSGPSKGLLECILVKKYTKSSNKAMGTRTERRACRKPHVRYHEGKRQAQAGIVRTSARRPYAAFLQQAGTASRKRDNSPPTSRHPSASRLCTFSHPDYTVGPGLSPDPPYRRQDGTGHGLTRECARAITAGGEFHPAPKVTSDLHVLYYIRIDLTRSPVRNNARSAAHMLHPRPLSPSYASGPVTRLGRSRSSCDHGRGTRRHVPCL